MCACKRTLWYYNMEESFCVTYWMLKIYILSVARFSSMDSLCVPCNKWLVQKRRLMPSYTSFSMKHFLQPYYEIAHRDGTSVYLCLLWVEMWEIDYIEKKSHYRDLLLLKQAGQPLSKNQFWQLRPINMDQVRFSLLMWWISYNQPI